jgi:hypothetical protein
MGPSLRHHGWIAGGRHRRITERLGSMRRDLLLLIILVVVVGRFGRLLVVGRRRCRRRMARAIDDIAPTVCAASSAAHRHGLMMVASTRIERGAATRGAEMRSVFDTELDPLVLVGRNPKKSRQQEDCSFRCSDPRPRSIGQWRLLCGHGRMFSVERKTIGLKTMQRRQ